jgi:DNA-binding transcriptional MerR regulator
VKLGRIGLYRTAGGHRRFDRAEVERLRVKMTGQESGQ